jgi:hypothetical protein
MGHSPCLDLPMDGFAIDRYFGLLYSGRNLKK